MTVLTKAVRTTTKLAMIFDMLAVLLTVIRNITEKHRSGVHIFDR